MESRACSATCGKPRFGLHYHLVRVKPRFIRGSFDYGPHPPTSLLLGEGGRVSDGGEGEFLFSLLCLSQIGTLRLEWELRIVKCVILTFYALRNKQ